AAVDAEARRKWLDQAVQAELLAKATPADRARALTELGEAYARLHRERRAEELWRKAIEAEPEYTPAALRLADLVADRGLPARAQAEVDAIAKKHPSLA